MIWVCFAATGHVHLAVTESTMKSSVYQSVLELNVQFQLNLGWNWVTKQISDAKHSSKPHIMTKIEKEKTQGTAML